MKFPMFQLVEDESFSTLKVVFGTVNITIHMPQRTSKILLVRLTANKNALLFQRLTLCDLALRVVIIIQ